MSNSERDGLVERLNNPTPEQLAFRRAWKESRSWPLWPHDPLDRLEVACERLGEAFDSYSADVIEELFNADLTDYASDVRRMLIELTLAIRDVRVSAGEPFGAFSLLSKRERADREQASLGAAREQGERVGYIKGHAEGRASHIDQEIIDWDVRRAVKSLPKRVDRRENWERALW